MAKKFNKKTGKRENKYPARLHVRNLLLMTLGSLITVSGLSIFVNPNNLLPGGVWGVSSILHHIIPVVPMSVFIVCINIPLLIWAWNKLNLRFALYTVYNVLLQSVLLLFSDQLLPHYTAEPILACIFGGVVVGLGSGIVVKNHGSSGGVDIIGIILNSKHDISVGAISLCFNGVIVVIAGIIFGIEPAMYTMVKMYISSTVFNEVLEGMNRKRNLMIVTDKGEEIAERLMFEIGRGCTIVNGEGGYTHQDKDVLFCVISRFEVATMKEIIASIDPSAFVIINQTHEVMGQFNAKGMPIPIFGSAKAAVAGRGEEEEQHD